MGEGRGCLAPSWGPGRPSTISTFRKFPRWCAAVYAECPYPDARDFLLENIVEEESGTKHVDLLIRFAEACGVSRAQVEHDPAPHHAGPDRLVLRDGSSALLRGGGRLAGGAGVPGAGHLPAQSAPLKPLYGFNDHEVEFFAIHIEADEIHGERGYEIVEHYSTTLDMRASRRGRAAGREMRWQYMTGLYRAYVLQEDS